MGQHECLWITLTVGDETHFIPVSFTSVHLFIWKVRTIPEGWQNSASGSAPYSHQGATKLLGDNAADIVIRTVKEEINVLDEEWAAVLV